MMASILYPTGWAAVALIVLAVVVALAGSWWRFRR
jgi:hypothetical protein